MVNHHQQQELHHPAMDDLVNLLTKANNDLTFVQNRLEKEFHQTYPHNANPLMLVSRMKKIQEDLSILKDQCRHLLAAKQDLIDKARTTLVGNRNLLQRMKASSGIPSTSFDDPTYTNFNQIIDEWIAQVRSKTGDKHDSDSQDINQLLFSTIVQSS
ncbi:hypothetical protein GIB67_014019 [Kingdonia uniflora]|uniref:Protein FAM33A n=1 Tax=Kingdonia uniflora TaxID=39325 RepID=A0A7J7L5N7_9MAGN|nr:hypothetical protein GIB67_014019 [Kingdonia uniflora]